MAGTFPRFRLYENDGTTLVYEFECVLDWENSPFQDPFTFVEHNSLRGQGSIISEGSNEPWDFPLTFILKGDDYEDLVSQMNSLKSTVARNTQYILKIDLTSGGSTKDLKVKRLQSFQFPVTNDKKKVINFQQGIVIFRVDSWS